MFILEDAEAGSEAGRQPRRPGGLTPVSCRGASVRVVDPRFGLRCLDPAR